MSWFLSGAHLWRLIAVIAAILTLLVMAESWIGHYRSGFPLRAQYAPFAVGTFLVATCAVLVALPDLVLGVQVARAAGWLAIVAGVIGVGYHHYYGIVEKAGGYAWLLHYLMYGAPQLAPLALSATGAFVVLATHGVAGNASTTASMTVRATLAVVAVALTGAVIETGILHYRGAFNTRLMYAPLLLPPLAVIGCAWLALEPSAGIVGVVDVLLWGTFLLGFLGAGMHLRGIDRQFGGLHVLRFNLLQGPPPFAPVFYAGFAAVGLLVLRAW